MLRDDRMTDTFLMRARRALAVCVGLVVFSVCTHAALSSDADGTAPAGQDAEVADAAPEEGSAEWADQLVTGFSGTGRWETEFVKDGKGDPEAVRLFLPSPLTSDGNAGPVLPLSPPLYVNRFRKIAFDDGVEGEVAFRFVDIGWNTAGQRNPGGPHFDILFSTRDLEEAKNLEDCPAGSKDCKPAAPAKEIARRIADRPAKCFLPSGSVPVAEKATPDTGLFNLASGPAGAPVEPVIFYGTYDDEIVFLGISLTLDTLQHAVDEGVLGERLSWPVSQPSRYKFAWWPRTVALEFRDDQNRFALSLEDFSERKVQSSCK